MLSLPVALVDTILASKPATAAAKIPANREALEQPATTT
jgi:hypothetical protein